MTRQVSAYALFAHYSRSVRYASAVHSSITVIKQLRVQVQDLCSSLLLHHGLCSNRDCFCLIHHDFPKHPARSSTQRRCPVTSVGCPSLPGVTELDPGVTACDSQHLLAAARNLPTAGQKEQQTDLPGHP